MNMTLVESSNVESVGYAGSTLYVSFRSGSEYAYSDVPYEIYKGLLESQSKGRYLHANVYGIYAFRRTR